MISLQVVLDGNNHEIPEQVRNELWEFFDNYGGRQSYLDFRIDVFQRDDERYINFFEFMIEHDLRNCLIHLRR